MKETKQRIIASNYYLMSRLSHEIEAVSDTELAKRGGYYCNEPKKLINFIANTHNHDMIIGVKRIRWFDILKNTYTKDATDTGGNPAAFFAFLLVLLIMNYVLMYQLMCQLMH